MLTELFQVLAFRSPSSPRAYLMFAAFAFLGGIVYISVTHEKPASVVRSTPGQLASAATQSSAAHGKVLAERFCQACHLLPDPASLDAGSWKHGALPMMGPRLGIFQHGSVDYSDNRNDQGLVNFYPTKPMVTEAEWQNIIDYYVTHAPARLPPQPRPRPIEMGLAQFTVEHPPVTYPAPVTSFVKILEGGGPLRLVISDVTREQTYFLDEDLVPVETLQSVGTIIGMDVHDGRIVACNIGGIHPNNEAYGKAHVLRWHPSGEVDVEADSLFGGALRRPAQVSGADLNGDGVRDYLVSEFGFLVGGLSWMQGRADGTFKKHLLSELPGPIRTVFEDYNHDGKTDFWVLFAQGQEGISLFTNQGGGRFKEEVVLRFPAVYGSSYFETVDFNGDGHSDVLYTCGDNADRTRVLKPYHGVYVFMNDGKNRFDQRYFYPINGCYKAVARDFDGDGDQDVAAISFFADYARQPEEAFVYLQNAGDLAFRPMSIEDGKRGRWLTMDAGDIDNDGDDDLVLGNFTLLGSAVKSLYDWKSAPQFLLFRNNQKE